MSKRTILIEICGRAAAIWQDNTEAWLLYRQWSVDVCVYTWRLAGTLISFSRARWSASGSHENERREEHPACAEEGIQGRSKGWCTPLHVNEIH